MWLLLRRGCGQGHPRQYCGQFLSSIDADRPASALRDCADRRTCLSPARVRPPARRDRDRARPPRRVAAGRARPAVPAARRPRRPGARARGRACRRRAWPSGWRASRSPGCSSRRCGGRRRPRRRSRRCSASSRSWSPSCARSSSATGTGASSASAWPRATRSRCRRSTEERWEVIPGAETMESFALRVRAGDRGRRRGRRARTRRSPRSCTAA